MNFKKKTIWVTLGSISLSLCLLAAVVVAGAYLVPTSTVSVEETGTGAAGFDSLPGYNGEYKVIESVGADVGISNGTIGRWEMAYRIRQRTASYDTACLRIRKSAS